MFASAEKATACKKMEVILYGLPNCPMCKVAKEFLKANGVSFIEHDVSKDKAAAKEMIVKTGQKQVPVVDIGGKFVTGFDQDKLEELLGL